MRSAKTFAPRTTGINWSSCPPSLIIAVSFLVMCTPVGWGWPHRSTVTPVDLRCEYLSEPLGIDVERTRLSWKLEAAFPDQRGQRQSAYRILVASSRKLLNKDKGDLWDSGQMESGRSHLVEYRGSPLLAHQDCYWKVRVRDNNDNLSPWSEPSRWTMGILDSSDWKSKWIGAEQQFTEIEGLPPEGDYFADPWFHRVITLEEKPKRATVYIASVGYHELYVNGRKVTDAVLMPNVADHTKRARYVTYEIADHL